MRRNIACHAMMWTLTAALAAPALAQDGGASIVERGTPDMGASGAGNTARADDPGTAHFNAAGMTRLERSGLLAGLFIAVPDQKLSLHSGATRTTPGGRVDGGGDIGHTFPAGGLYVVVAPESDWRFGLTMNGLYGGSVDYDDNWTGRTFVTDASIVAMNIEPAVAYKLNDNLSLGFGLNAVNTVLDVKFKATNAPGSPTVHIHDADDWGFGYTLSALYEFDDKDTRLGLRFRSGIDLDLSGGINGPPGSKVNFDSDMDLPASISLGAYHRLSDKWALMADTSWTDWSAFSQAPTTLGAINVPIDRDWDDTWRLGIGAEHQWTDTLTLRFGVSYDSDPVSDSKRLPDIPTSEFWRFSVGLEVALDEDSSLGFTYTYAYMGHPSIDGLALPPTRRTVIDGRYDDSSIQFFGLTYTLMF